MTALALAVAALVAVVAGLVWHRREARGRERRRLERICRRMEEAGRVRVA